MSMTWKDLSNKINTMTDEQKNTDVTFFDNNDGEFFALGNLLFTNENNCDILDHDHPYLTGWENPKGYCEGLELTHFCKECDSPCNYDSEVCLCDDCKEEQRRDEKNGLYPEKADISN